MLLRGNCGRARSSFVRSTQAATLTLEDLLDQSILVNIFPLIAAYNGERARNIPQVLPATVRHSPLPRFQSRVQTHCGSPLRPSAEASRSSAQGEAASELADAEAETLEAESGGFPKP
jgi:hypothetical protein